MPKSILTNFVEDLTQGLGMNIEIEDSPSYTLNIRDKELQLEMDDSGEKIIVSMVLGKVPSGRYREDVLEQSLKSNDYPPPHFGYLGYSLEADILVLHREFHFSKISKKTVMDSIPPFIQMAEEWSRALETSSVPIASKPDPSTAPNMLQILGLEG